MAGTSTSLSSASAGSNWLPKRLERIRRKARQLLWINGLCRLVALVLGGVLAAGTLDWLIHIDDAGVRMLIGLAILGGALWIGWRHLLQPLSQPVSHVEIALRVERRFPDFRDALASAVQFLEQRTDSRLGSPDLQRRVIEQTMLQAEQFDLDDVFDTSNVRRWLLAAAGAGMVCAAAVGFDRSQAAIAFTRLVNPFTDTAWPRTTELQFIDRNLEPLRLDPAQPLRLARGDQLELYIENKAGPLPDDVRLVYELADGRQITESLRPSTLRNSDGSPREACAGILTPQGPSMRFRATGGDDDAMPWYRLELVPPPMIVALQVAIVPPAYSRRPPERLHENVGHVEGLLGTRVEVAARSGKPLKSAHLQRTDRPTEPLPLGRDSRQFQASFVIDQAGTSSYGFDLTDEDGFENTRAPRYEIRGITDAPPQVSLEIPAGDQYVTPAADVPLGILVKDDVGLVEVRVPFRVTGAADEAGSTFPLPFEPPLATQADLEAVWRLSELPLVAGMQIVFHAEATDAFDLDSPHVGKSQQRTLTIVTAEEKTAEIALRQTGLLEEFDQILKVQSRAHSQVGELQTQLNTAGQLQGQDVDLLKRIEVDQRQITARLENPVDGIESRILGMLSEFEQNKLADTETEQRLRAVADELAVLRVDHLPKIEQNLTDARKSAQSALSGSRPLADPPPTPNDEPSTPGKGAGSDRRSETPRLETTAADPENPRESSSQPDRGRRQSGALAAGRRHQSAVLESLAGIVERLSQWQRQRDLIGHLEDITRDQKAIERDTAEIGSRTLSKSWPELTPQQRADLNRLAVRERGLADRFDQFRSKLESLSDEPPGSMRSASEMVKDALDLSDRRATAGRMRQTADEFESNQVGQAADSQRQILQDLAELEESLSGRNNMGAQTRLEKLEQAEQQLEQLRKRQEELARENTAAAADPSDSDSETNSQELERLVKHQQQLRTEAADMSRRLRRLRANNAGRSSGRGAASMQRAEQNLVQRERRAAAENQQEAIDDLEQAQRELARARHQAQQELAQELVRQLADVLPGLAARQQNVIDETVRLETLRADRGNWSRGQLITLRNLTNEQKLLEEESKQLAERIQPAQTFALGMRGVRRHMARAGQRLSERKTDAETLNVEKAAHKRLLDLIDALEPPSDQEPHQEPPAAPAQGEQRRRGPATDVISLLAQLKLLKTMQADLMERTAELEPGGLSSEELRELESLAAEQGELAQLARSLAAHAAVPDGDDGNTEEDDGSDEVRDPFDLPVRVPKESR